MSMEALWCSTTDKSSIEQPAAHHMLSQEESTGNGDDEVIFEGRADDFDWKKSTLVDL